MTHVIDAFFATQWLITEEKLLELCTFIEHRELGMSLLQEYEARGPAGDEPKPEKPYLVTDNGLAVLPLRGVITRRANYLTRFSGGTSTELYKRDFLAAVNDPAVRSIVLDVDSPGGAAPGVSDLSDTIYNARGKKPIIAVANELMGSAALWIGTAADRVLTQSTAAVGSLGAYTLRRDISGAEQKAGIRTTLIRSGKYKGLGNPSIPLTDEELQYAQGQINTLHALFVSAVARNRGLDADTVQQRAGDSQVFLGAQAIDAGLADAIGSLDEVLTSTAAAGSFTNPQLLERSAAHVDCQPEPHLPPYAGWIE